MERFLQNLLTASIHGSILIFAVLLLRLVLFKTPKKYICFLWLLAGIRLLLPIEIRSDLSLQPELTPSFAKIFSQKWAAVLLWAWAVIAACFAIYSLISYLKLKDRVRDAIRIRGGWESSKIETAFILGFIKPKIYIPMGMDSQSRQNILAHERTHLDKGDHWIKMIGFLALALHWFNPLVWVAYILLCKDIETACDERVIRFMELDERKAYSSALLRCSSRRAHFAASPVAFGEVSVKQRILSILKYKKPSFWLSLLGVLAFFFVAVCFLTSPPAAQTEVLSPEEQANLAKIEQCREELEAQFAKEAFCAAIQGRTSNGSVRWTAKLYWQGEDTLWTLCTSYQEGIAEGYMERAGKHYAWYSDSWMLVDKADTRFGQWLDLFRWDMDTAAFVEDTQEDGYDRLRFTTQWEGEDQTIHTQTVQYTSKDTSVWVQIERPNYPDVDIIALCFGENVFFPEISKPISQVFEEAEAAIRDENVTNAELESQAVYNDWGVSFRVDDDRLSSAGSDISFYQMEFGKGNLFTTDEYWIEKYTDGTWERVPTVTTPNWEGKGYGVAKMNSTYEYLDWSPLYGQLEPGLYRMGKRFENRGQEGNGVTRLPAYAEFTILETVNGDTPEAKAAVERCYTKLEELKQRKVLHWKTVSAKDSEDEVWADGEDFLHITHFFGPDVPEEQLTENDRRLIPRTDTMVRYDGVGYETLREDPDVPASKDLGLAISTLSPTRGGWSWYGSIGEDLNMSFYERKNQPISFPEGIGVISDEKVCFAAVWDMGDGTQEMDIYTYRFDEDGNLVYMEFKPIDDGPERVFSMEIFADTQTEIQEKIQSAVRDVVTEPFSWTQDQAKYTSGDFNIRQDSFVNTQVSPVTGPVQAARLAKQEYPNLPNEYSIRVFRDDTMGMWKVTIKTEVAVQSEYEYRDVYLSDSGVTQLLVYEGPLRFDEPRK